LERLAENLDRSSAGKATNSGENSDTLFTKQFLIYLLTTQKLVLKRVCLKFNNRKNVVLQKEHNGNY